MQMPKNLRVFICTKPGETSQILRHYEYQRAIELKTVGYSVIARHMEKTENSSNPLPTEH